MADMKMTITNQYREWLKDYEIGTVFERQTIIDGIRKKFGSKPNIWPSDYCYNMSNKGSDRTCFFVNTEKGLYKYVGEDYLKNEILKVVSAYKENFKRIDKEERYKWKAQKWFEDHWNIDDENFLEMFKISYQKAANLLRSRQYEPLKGAVNFIETNPDKARKLFKMLYQEEIRKDNLEEIYSDFTEAFNSDLEKTSIYKQDLHSVSIYLSFKYPNNYFIYKKSVYNGFKNLVGFEDKKSKLKIQPMKNNDNLFLMILSVVKEDEELLKMHRARLEEDCYQDEAFHFLAQDIAYFGSKIANSKYHPSLEEYDPGISAETWRQMLKDESVTSADTLKMLKMMFELGGESTCAKLAETYGNTYNHYNLLGSSYGKKIKEKMDCPAFIENGQERYYPIPFVGRDVLESGKKRFSWKLRNELEEALENMENTDIKIEESKTDIPLNTILYGPPGTGKTYNSVIYAVAIVEDKPLKDVENEAYEDVTKRYNEYKENGLIEFTTFHQSYGYEEFIEGIRPVMNSDCGDVQYEISSGAFKEFCEKAENTYNKTNRVFIIDEINRGNISKIFGELITLIEPTKRLGQLEGMKAVLPYSQKLFGVPDNVYIIGTMNTADRSISTIDTALRRRFRFKEMMPDAEVLNDVVIDGIAVKDMLVRMNKRITVLYDREHTIGHAYFTSLKENPTIDTLAEIFRNSVIPLLQEYFYEDYEKIRLVLGDNNKSDEAKQFITVCSNNYSELFGDTDFEFDETNTYEINEKAFMNPMAYKLI